MKWMKRNKQRQNHPDSLTEQAIGGGGEKRAISQSGRRGIFGLLKKGLGVSVAATGVAMLFKESSGTARADAIGAFSSSVGGTPAISAFGGNGAQGIQVYSDSSSAIYATT